MSPIANPHLSLSLNILADHPGQPTTAPKEEGKKKKKGGGKTVSSVYLVSLIELMVLYYPVLHILDTEYIIHTD